MTPARYVCPSCNRVTALWGYCRNCGFRVRASAAPVPPLRHGGGAPLCGVCAWPLRGSSPYCPNCGSAQLVGAGGIFGRRKVLAFLVGCAGTLLILVAYPVIRAIMPGSPPRVVQPHQPSPPADVPKDTPAPAPAPSTPPDQPLTPEPPRSGSVRWSGILQRGGIVIISGDRASGLSGKLLTAGLPGIPVVVTPETPGILILRTPNRSNGWRYVVFKSTIEGRGEVVLQWEALSPRPLSPK